MIRIGYYVSYLNKEYEIVSSKRNGFVQYNLRSLHEEDLITNGFQIYERPKSVIASDGKEYQLKPKEANEPSIYIKIVTPDEVGEVNYIQTFCTYKGFDFRISNEFDGKYLIYTNDETIATGLHFEQEEPFSYRKWISTDSVEKIWETKTPQPNFFKKV